MSASRPAKRHGALGCARKNKTNAHIIDFESLYRSLYNSHLIDLFSAYSVESPKKRKRGLRWWLSTDRYSSVDISATCLTRWPQLRASLTGAE